MKGVMLKCGMSQKQVEGLGEYVSSVFKPCFAKLQEDLQYIVESRANGISLQEIGDTLHVTRERVRQRESQAYRLLAPLLVRRLLDLPNKGERKPLNDSIKVKEKPTTSIFIVDMQGLNPNARNALLRNFNGYGTTIQDVLDKCHNVFDLLTLRSVGVSKARNIVEAFKKYGYNID